MEHQVLQSNEILDVTVFSVELRDVRMSDGSQVQRHIVRHPGSVAVVAVDAEDRIALVEQFRPSIGRRVRELPAGRRDDDILVVARMELRQEVGVDSTDLSVLGEFLTTPGHSDHITTIVLAQELRRASDGDRSMDESTMTVSWHSLDEALDLVLSSPDPDAKTVLGLALAKSALDGRSPAENPRLTRDQAIALLGPLTDRFLSDNAGIWTTGAIFVPAAYAAPAIYFSLTEPSWLALIVLGSLSVLVSSAWLLLGERHRVFQDAHIRRITYLETEYGLATTLPPANEQSRLGRMVTRVGAASLRRMLALAVVPIWAAIALARLMGW